jgi:Ser/Thr protein kinase RdoA (MazF antagonist)
MSEHVLAAFGLKPEQFDVRPFGSGHINKTYLASDNTGEQHYILQRINTYVFKRPQVIAKNHRLTWEHLSARHPDYLFPKSLPTTFDGDLYIEGEDFWRLMPYVEHTVTVDKADTPRQAFEAARQFGRFAKLTSGIDLSAFEPTIPDFHNLSLRARQFEDAIENASDERKVRAGDLIDFLQEQGRITEQFETVIKPALPDRLMHHDTKINNVLLREGTFEGVCVIDLDTLMPGKIVSDLGDMVRTYVCPVPEDETDVSRVCVRDDFFAALVQGYLAEVRGELTALEKEQIFFAGEFMVYMQALRFLADYLNGDVYYPVKYPEHNLDRARNQAMLLMRLMEKEQPLKEIIRECL